MHAQGGLQTPRLVIFDTETHRALGPIQTKEARLFRRVLSRAFTPKQNNAGRRMNTSAVIGLDVDQVKHAIWPRRLAFFPSVNFTLPPKRRPPTGPI